MNERITKEVVEQYEQIRALGSCNMFDFYCVQEYAFELELYDLAELDKKEYIYILSNYDKLMKEFDIQRN